MAKRRVGTRRVDPRVGPDGKRLPFATHFGRQITQLPDGSWIIGGGRRKFASLANAKSHISKFGRSPIPNISKFGRD